MAITLADAVVLLGADDSGLKADLGRAEKATGGWAGNVAGMAKTALTGAVVGAGVAAAAAVAKIGVEAFNVSRDTEKASANIAAALGIPIEAAEQFGEVARRVYGNNFAGSVTEAGEAVAFLAQQMGLAADDPALQTLTEHAFALQDAFGTDVTESVDAATSLMESFGITGQEAFDLITAGQQAGLDRSGDFLDTITEYSTQFAGAGVTAGDFFTLLDSGLQGGALGTDKAADAFKEYMLRVTEGGDDVGEAFAAMGMDLEQVQGSIRAGDESFSDYFDNVIAGLASIEDPIERQRAGIAIMGTQFEDLGADAVLNLQLMNGAFDEVSGTTESLGAQYQTFGDLFAGVWRKAVVAIAPVTDALLAMVNDAMPFVEQGFDLIAQVLSGKMIPQLTATNTTFALLKTWFDQNMPLIQQTVETVLGAIADFWSAHGETITAIAKFAWDLISTIINTTLLTILDIIKIVMQLINGDWEGALMTMQGVVERVWAAIVALITAQINLIKTVITGIDWGSLGAAIVGGIADGIKNGVQAIVDAAKAAALKALAAAKRALGIGSPSRVAAKEVGKPFSQGIGVGIQDELNRVARNVSTGLNVMLGGAAGTTAAGPVAVTLYQNFGGEADAGLVRRGSTDGVLAGLRQAGLR